MWHEITNKKDLSNFMNDMCHFHDSCIKELKYSSGAYVGQDLFMYPFNDRRILTVIIQRQFRENSMIEMEFQGLKFLKLFPIGEGYTCEILDSAMFLKDGCFYWCDDGDVSEADLEDYSGTMICAEKFRWRTIENRIDNEEFYRAVE